MKQKFYLDFICHKQPSETAITWRSKLLFSWLFLLMAVLGTNNAEAQAGINWTTRTSAADNSWLSVTYGNGLFVAASINGIGNRVMTSPDGITWTSRSSAADNIWNSVTYGNGMFVAVSQSGTGNRVMTSPDGITWTSRASAAENSWNSVTYGNGLFVAVSSTGVGNRVMTSPDGMTWTSRTSAADNSWNSVTHGNGLFVAVSNSGTGNRVMTSPDGITWTSRTSAADYSWRSVTYGNGNFVAVSQTGVGNRVMTSPDGITWTSRSSAADNTWNSVTYGNEIFVAVSVSGVGNKVMTSPDGITWTSRSSAINNWRSVTYANGTFVAVSSSGVNDRVMTSSVTAPTVTTTTASAITATEASSGGNVTSDGGDPVTERGIAYSTSPEPSIKETRTSDGTGTGTFTSSLTGLTPNTTYYYRTYAINSVNVSYGPEMSFTTTSANPDSDNDGVPDADDCALNDATKWRTANLYIDADGDGYDAGQQEVCYGANIPAGYSTTTLGTDCNDTNAAINPDATEVCDGVDNNCNGQTDEGLKPEANLVAIPENDVYTGGIPTNIYLGYGPQSVTLNPQASNGTDFTYEWSDADGLSCTDCAMPVFTPTMPGTYNISVLITNETGCSETFKITLCVTDIRVAGSKGTKVWVCFRTKANNFQGNPIASLIEKVYFRVTPNSLYSLGWCEEPCNAPVPLEVTDNIDKKAALALDMNEDVDQLTVKVAPNPSAGAFTLHISSNQPEPVKVRVMDMSGNVLTTLQNIKPNTTVRTGENFSTGIYLAEITQNKQRVVIKLMKTK